MEILGVDFSGAKTDDRTWVASGVLDGAGLRLYDIQPVTRAGLAEMVLGMPGDSVAALDFPFSVPQSFAQYWAPEAVDMPELWAAASAMDLPQFMALRDDFVSRCGEPKRLCDLRFPESYSCLHKANPNMVPMTFHGMRLLGPLWRAGCVIPPLESPEKSPDKSENQSKMLLLEAMPGAALKAMHLPYKGYKKGANAQALRLRILDGLEERSGVGIKNLAEFRERCAASDDCLDAVVAAVVASLWARDPSLFWCPSLDPPDGPESVSQLEGWLYAPIFL